MTSNYKRKADDNQIIALNNVGMSLTAIAKMLDVHHTTIKYRLKALGIEPADTRRAFMTDVFDSLSLGEKAWLIDQLGPDRTVKDYIRTLIKKDFINRTATGKAA